MQNYKSLTVEILPEVLENMIAFTLVFHDKAGKSNDLQWVVDRALLSGFRDSIAVDQVEKGYITTKALHQGYIKTRDNQVFKFGLHDVKENNSGFMIVGGRAVPLRNTIRFVVERSFGLKKYNSFNHFFAGGQGTTESRDVPGAQAEGASGNDDGIGLVDKSYTVIFWSDDDGRGTEKFANAYEEKYGQNKLTPVLIYPAKKPDQIAGIGSKIKSGKIVRIIYATHGLPAEFDTAYEGKTNNSKCVGLYPKNTSPSEFAQAIATLGELVADNATLLILACDVAATATFQKQILNGQDILTTIASEANLTVYGANCKTWINQDPSAYIKPGAGSIYFATPTTPAAPFGGTYFPIANGTALEEADFEYVTQEAFA